MAKPGTAASSCNSNSQPAPVFFASIGLRVDFVAAFDLRLALLVLVLATVPKLVGCSVGARVGGLKWRQAIAVGFGMNVLYADEQVSRDLEESAGAESQVRVLVESSDGEQEWITVGSSTNIIEASWLALADSLEYWLLKQKTKGKRPKR